MFFFLFRLKLRCEFINEGCLSVVEYGSLSEHVKFCEYNPNRLVQCPYGCSVLVETKKIGEHKCYSNFEKFIKILLILTVNKQNIIFNIFSSVEKKKK